MTCNFEEQRLYCVVHNNNLIGCYETKDTADIVIDSIQYNEGKDNLYRDFIVVDLTNLEIIYDTINGDKFNGHELMAFFNNPKINISQHNEEPEEQSEETVS